MLGGKTTILIAHRLSSARRCDRIVLLDGGVIAEQGSHDELIARGGRYARLWETHASGTAPFEPGLFAAAGGSR